MKGEPVKEKPKSKPARERPKADPAEKKQGRHTKEMSKGEAVNESPASKPTEEKSKSPFRVQGARPTIGLLLETTAGSGEYQVIMWNGIVDAAQEWDVNLLCFAGGALTYSPFDEFERQRNVLYDLAAKSHIDGVIFSSTLGNYAPPDELERLYDRFRPRPMVNIAKKVSGIHNLLVDNYQGMHDVIVHLIEVHRHRRIAFIRGPEGNEEAQQRYRAYTDTLAEYGLPFDPDLVASGNFDRQSGAEAVRALLDQRATGFEAVVAANDGMAFGVLEVLQARGIYVPGDVAVVGFDDVGESSVITPSLTTVRQPMHRLGRQAIESLLALLAGEEVPEQTLFPTELVVRQSCGCLAKEVLQAAAEVTRTTGSSKIALRTRREAILPKIEQAIHPSAIARAEAGRLFNAFAAALEAESPDIFLRALDGVLRQAIVTGDDMLVWQGMLSALRRHTLPHLGRDKVLRQAEDLWQQGRTMIGEAAQRAQARRRLQAGLQAATIQGVSQALVTTFDIEELMDVAARQLPLLGIRSCHLSLYEGKKMPPQWSRLILAYNEKGRIKLGAGGQRFPSYQLVPSEMLPVDKQYSMVVDPLYFREEQIGFALLDVGPRDGTVYETLRSQISSALQGALLVRQVEHRALQLQTAAEVSRVTSSILNLDELLPQVVDLARDRFALYYAGLFLVDQTGEWTGEPGRWAVLRAGTGAAGHKMLKQGHKLEIGSTSMIGWCIANKQAHTALDVGTEAVRFDNPLLPETRSEMALPLISRGEAIGALSIQSAQEAAFSQEDIAVLQTMADQLANAIANARLYETVRTSEESERRFREQLSALHEMGTELSKAPTFDDLCRLAVELGHSQLGFDRLGIWFLDEDPQFMRGSFGIDENGQLRDERDKQLTIAPGQANAAILYGQAPIVFEPDLPLRDDTGAVVGRGWQIVTAIRDASKVIGRISADNLLRGHPIERYQLELLRLYGVTLGHLCTRKRAEEVIERRAMQLQAAAEVAREAVTILDVRQLLDRTAHLISEQFGFYHVSVFLTDEHNEYAILRAASSAGGQRMLERGHRLRVSETSIVGYVAATGESRIALDVGVDAVFFDNPDLPDTRSEMALPLKVRERTIGVLDVQSTVPSAFTAEDVTALQTMADQLAVAIDNAGLIERAESQLRELRLLYGEYSATTWSKATARALGYVYDRTGVSPVADAPLPAFDMAMQNSQTVNVVEPETEGAVLAIPLKVREQVIGTLGLQVTDSGREWSPEEVALVEAVGEQVALALENAQLFAETQRTAQSMEALYETSRALSTSLEEESLMHAILEGVYRTLGCEHVVMSTVDEEAGTIGFKHGIWQGEFDRAPEWVDLSRYSLDHPDILTDVYRTGRTEIVAGWDARLDREVYEKFGHERFLRIFMPVKMRERTLGIVEVGYDRRQKDRVTEEEVQMLAAFMDQAAVALENARLFEQAQQRAQREHQIYEITSRIRRSPDISTILQTAVDELGRALRTDRAMVRLLAKPRAKE